MHLQRSCVNNNETYRESARVRLESSFKQENVQDKEKERERERERVREQQGENGSTRNITHREGIRSDTPERKKRGMGREQNGLRGSEILENEISGYCGNFNEFELIRTEIILSQAWPSLQTSNTQEIKKREI